VLRHSGRAGLQLGAQTPDFDGAEAIRSFLRDSKRP
jgi:hypothetical protein